MKCTLLVTRKCNLACKYCYVGKSADSMSLAQAGKIVDLAYECAVGTEPVSFAFFGGEPLLEFRKIQDICKVIKDHPDYEPNRVTITIVTNGTIFSDAIARFILNAGIAFGISCDGPPHVHDRFRRYRNGKASCARVEDTIRKSLAELSRVMVNAVYRPETLANLPETVGYFSDLGVRQIYLSPDYSAPWTASEAKQLDHIYGRIGESYIAYYRRGDPHFISLIDSKIAVILRGGYRPEERCHMGTRELAFTPDGSVYPCERLVGNEQSDSAHRLGSVEQGFDVRRMDIHRSGEGIAGVCSNCSLKRYCMNWCGCSNYFGAGSYDRVSPFLCASERAAIRSAARVYEALEQHAQSYFYEHASGSPLINSLGFRSSDRCGMS